MPKFAKEIQGLEEDLSDANLYADDPAGFQSKSERLAACRNELDEAEQEWLELEEKREAIDAGRS